VSDTPQVSVVVPISERHDRMDKLYSIYAAELREMKQSFEFIFVVDGAFPLAVDALKKLQSEGEPIRIIQFARSFGESMALMEGFRQAKGELILTLASYIQIEPKDLHKVFDAYNAGHDMVITRRYPRKDPLINRIQASIYHYVIRKLTNTSFRDITSGMRLISRKVLSEFVLYGDLHRFLPIFAFQRGVNVREIKVGQRKEDTQVRVVNAGAYVRRLLDILTLFFLVKFTKKPLRFFGLIGVGLGLPGVLIIAYLGVLRLFYGVGLADRPFLLMGILLLVFGFHLFSVGLIGELIIYCHSREVLDYRVKKIIE